MFTLEKKDGNYFEEANRKKPIKLQVNSGRKMALIFFRLKIPDC